MCTTCGCSIDAWPRVTNLQTGEVAFIDEGAGHGAHGRHARDHDHAHHHDHDHGYDHGHLHAHDDPDHHGHEHSHGYRQSHERDISHGYRQSHAEAREHVSTPDSGGGRGGPGSVVALERSLLAKNGMLAERNRGWLAGRGILAINWMSSPGAGKTSLLERMLRDLRGELALSVIEGDQETLNDAERIRATGCSVVQINTGTGCHLDAEMLARGLTRLDPPAGSVVMIENVGNLVCPALFDLGEATKVVIMSVTEGEDKPLKYPHMFRASELMILNKTDLLPHVQFDVDRCTAAARRVNPDLQILQTSATRGDGLTAVYDWLRARRADHQRQAAFR